METKSGWWAVYERTPLYVRIVVAMAIGIAVGVAMGTRAAIFKPVSDIVLRLLGALATPLIFCALTHALLSAQVTGRSFARMLYFLITNTVVAIVIGLAVANLMQPGRWVAPAPVADETELRAKVAAAEKRAGSAGDAWLDKIPGSALRPLVDNEIIGVIILALALGIALRSVRAQEAGMENPPYRVVEQFLDVVFRCVMILLHWVFHLVPLAVFAVVARLVGEKGFAPFLQLGGFVVAVLLALALQAGFYLFRVGIGSWVRPGDMLRGSRDALAMGFSTASSAATLPVTFECATRKIGVSEKNATMAVMVGGSLNNDGTALYEAMAALFISQMIGQHLGLADQLVVVLMAIFASVGAAGIPEAGLVTMVAVFRAVDLDPELIPLLLTVDWFLDRCRTAINIMGDFCVACLLEGRQPDPAPPTMDVPAA